MKTKSFTYTILKSALRSVRGVIFLLFYKKKNDKQTQGSYTFIIY